MFYNNSTRCGIKEASGLTKVYLNRYTSYSVVLSKEKEELYGPIDPCSVAEFYLADSTGLPVCKDEGTISLQNEEGTDVTVPWNMSNYMKAAGFRWQSKVQLF